MNQTILLNIVKLLENRFLEIFAMFPVNKLKILNIKKEWLKTTPFFNLMNYKKSFSLNVSISF